MTSNRWSDELLDRARQVGDSPADDAIAEIYDLGQEQEVRETLLGFDRNSEQVPTELPPLLRSYFEKTALLPSWAEQELIDRGHLLLGRYQPQIATILLSASLPLCYGCGDGAQVLYQSKRLTGAVYRRLMETSQFVVDVLDTGGLGPNARGVRSAQMIRLLHATMRYHITRRGDWDYALGMPINQEDLSGTLQSFSTVVIQGLDRLGVQLKTGDRDAYFHIWRVVGHILGVNEDLNPALYEDGKELWERILSRQQRKTEAGIALTKGVLEFIREVLPGPAFEGVGPTMIRHLAGDHAADLVGVPPAGSKLGMEAGSALNLAYSTVGNAVPSFDKVSGELGIAIFKAGVRLTNKGRSYQWQIPTGLTEPS
jgi:hypothetical protein